MNRKQIFSFSLLLFFLLFLFIACYQKAKEQKKQEVIVRKSKKLNILATTTIVHDLIKQIGGKRIISKSLMGPGVDPHAYRAKEEDSRLLYKADVIFYNGLHLEAKLGNILKKLSQEKKIFALADGISPHKLIKQGKKIYDPHIWFSVDLWKDAAKYVNKKLKELDPSFKGYYHKRYLNYLEDLNALNKSILEKINQIDPARRILITGHDAFAYFGKAYGIKVLGIQGINTLAQANVADIENLANFIIKKKIPALFIETSISKKNVVAVQASVFAKGYSLIIGGELFTDALGSAEENTSTYIEMFNENMNRIVYGLNQ